MKESVRMVLIEFGLVFGPLLLIAASLIWLITSPLWLIGKGLEWWSNGSR